MAEGLWVRAISQVEGAELDVLRGGRRVFARDRPLFTTEVHVLLNRSFTLELVRHIEGLGYTPLLVHNESCGQRTDCRNLVNVPTERLTAALRAHIEVNATRLVPVSSGTMHRLFKL